MVDSSARIQTRWSWLALTIALVVGVLYSMTLREGHNWGGDFSMYVHHAKNLAEGRDYGDTPYIYNSHYPEIGPETYPPVFPLLLTPVYMLRGFDLNAMKMVGVLFFTLFLVFFYLTLKDEFPRRYVIASMIILGASPYFLKFKDNVISDLPFLFFIYVSFFFITQPHRLAAGDRRVHVWAFLAGLSIFLACGTRSLGLLLLPCAYFYNRAVGRNRLIGSAITFGMVAALLATLSLSFHGEMSYYELITDSIATQTSDGGSGIIATLLTFVLHNIEQYLVYLALFWHNGYSVPLCLALFAAVSALAALGFTRRIRRRVTVFEFFFVLYGAPLIILPFAQARYVIPLLPLLLLYSFEGLGALRRFGGERLESRAAVALVTLVLASFAFNHWRADSGDIAEGVGKPETKELFAYVSNQTRQEDVFLFIKPRVLALYTGRGAAAYYAPERDSELWSYAGMIGATHLIVGPPLFDHTEKAQFIRGFVQENEDQLDRVFSNADFDVYRFAAAENAR